MIEISDNIFSYISSLYGENAAKIYAEFIKLEPAQYIRSNPFRIKNEILLRELEQDYSVEAEEISSVPNAFKISKGRNIIGKTIGHITGEYYIQSLSSMIPAIVLAAGKNDATLDLCAAPGSKTTQIGAMMNNEGTLIANEIALDRVKMLIYNIDRMNLMNIGVTNTKGEWLSKIYDSHFDKILVDAPCSGLGIVQKKEEVSNWWSRERAERLCDLQLRLLISAVKMLKPDGTVVYSTCTLTPEENELLIDKVLKKYPVKIEEIELPVKSNEGFTSYSGHKLDTNLVRAKRILPWEVDSDGFFIVKLRKTGETKPLDISIPKLREIRLINSSNKEIRDPLKIIQKEFGIKESALQQYHFIVKQNDIFFIDKNWQDDNPGLFVRIGTKFGIFNKDGKVILHTQAGQILQHEITKGIFNIEKKEDLKKYFGGAIIKEKSMEPGQIVIKYKGSVIGTAVVTKEGIKSRFPRSRRTQEILIP